MKKPKTNYDSCLEILSDLKKDYPTTPISQHLYSALADYGNFWGISDKETLFALEKYQSERQMNVASEKDVEKIVEDGKNLEKLFLDDEDEGDEWP